MSLILEEIVNNRIPLDECLQRLLIIANKTNNTELSNWCLLELNGYSKYEELPSYRKIVSRMFTYSGINGGYNVTNIPLQLSFLNEKTLDRITKVGLFDPISKVEDNKKLKENIYRDMSFLAPEVYNNTYDGMVGVQCTSIRQVIPQSAYYSLYSSVKSRVINLLCAYESAKIDIDKFDINSTKLNQIKKHNYEVFEEIVLNGKTFTFGKKESKLVWNIIVPLVVAIISGIITWLITTNC